MAGITRLSGRRLCVVVPAAASLVAWAALVVGGRELTPSFLCASGLFGARSPSTSLELLVALNRPAAVAGSVMLMLAAMMLPLIPVPLRHVYDRSFARRRGRGIVLFVAGYWILWMGAALALEAVALAARWAAPSSFACFVAALVAAVLWQASPGKQWCLNRCHRRLQLAAFGVAADRDAFVFGLTHGASCVGACWALMLLPLTAANLHVTVMAAVALFVAAERVERPAPIAWRWRWPGRVIRMTAARLCLASGQLGGASHCFSPVGGGSFSEPSTAFPCSRGEDRYRLAMRVTPHS
jgi:predicted metal-binding membrane protein